MEPETNAQPTISSGSGHAIGPLVGALIVLAVLVLGGVYFLSNKTANVVRNAPPVILGDTDVHAGLPPTTSSDTISDISADVEATDLNELDSQINADLQTVESNI